MFSSSAAASIKLGEYREAIADCETALSLQPTSGIAYNRLGCVYQPASLILVMTLLSRPLTIVLYFGLQILSLPIPFFSFFLSFFLFFSLICILLYLPFLLLSLLLFKLYCMDSVALEAQGKLKEALTAHQKVSSSSAHFPLPPSLSPTSHVYPLLCAFTPHFITIPSPVQAADLEPGNPTFASILKRAIHLVQVCLSLLSSHFKLFFVPSFFFLSFSFMPFYLLTFFLSLFSLSISFHFGF